MELKTIRLKNFRQFFGEQTISFAEGDANITIIFGENGKGKTGIFRALIFGLFGQKNLSQDEEAKDSLHLVNMIELDNNPGVPVEAWVEIEFVNKGINYLIKRIVSGRKEKEIINERIVSQQLNYIDQEGNFSPKSITNEKEIEEIMKDIINKEIRDFFLFDGEKIETLAKTTLNARKDIKKGITRLLQIDSLDKAISLLKDIYNKNDRKLREESKNNDIRKIGDKRDLLKGNIEKLNEDIDNYEIQKIECQNEISEIEIKLAENNEIKEIQKEINSLNKDINNQKSLMDQKKQGLRNGVLINSYQFFLENTFQSTGSYLDQILYTQKDNIPIGIIEKILREQKCICGTDLTAFKEALANIERLKSNYERSTLTSIITKIKDGHHDFSNRREDLFRDLKEGLIDIRSLKDQIDDLVLKKQKYSESIRELSRKEKNLEALEGNLEKIKKDLKNYEINIAAKAQLISNQEKELKKLEDDYKDALLKDESLKDKKERINYLQLLQNNFELIFNSYTSNMRIKLEEEVTKIFKKIIDPKDREVINKICISNNYEIEVLNWNGTKMTQDISQGQRQMVALAFVTALAKLASGDNQSVSFPLFMDTPFGRISGNNRDNLIENIPYLTTQWILLLTDTEYTLAEENKLKSTNKLGKVYKLNQVGPGQTKIESLSIDSSIATRRI